MFKSLLSTLSNKPKAKDKILAEYKFDEGSKPHVSKDVLLLSEIISDEMSNMTSINIGMNLDEELEKLYKIRDANKELLEKARISSDLGFRNSPSVIRSGELEAELKISEYNIDEARKNKFYYEEYRLMFPGYKFVPEEVFKTVLINYGLVTEERRDYIKEVPEKNLLELDHFLKVFKGVRVRVIRYSSGTIQIDLDKNFSVRYPEEDYPQYYGDSVRSQMECEILISAPKDHFRDKPMRNSSGDDPIITLTVPGGRLVITKWDKEADIPEIQNEHLN